MKTTYEKDDFYVTFGQKDLKRKDGWIRLINCHNKDEAQSFAMKKFNRDFSMLYNHEDFKPKYFPKGELAVISSKEIEMPVLDWLENI